MRLSNQSTQEIRPLYFVHAVVVLELKQNLQRQCDTDVPLASPITTKATCSWFVQEYGKFVNSIIDYEKVFQMFLIHSTPEISLPGHCVQQLEYIGVTYDSSYEILDNHIHKCYYFAFHTINIIFIFNKH